MTSFSHSRPVRNKAKEIVGQKPAPAVRITRGVLGYHHGTDKNKALVVSLKDGDLIEIRPARTSRPKVISAFDLYDYLVRLEAGVAEREKREARKQKKAERLARLRQERAEKKLFRK